MTLPHKQAEIETSLMDVDRKTALIYLEKNNKNRRLNQYRLKKYGEQMANGAWKLNGEPIIIGVNGELLDGQHRLRAIADYNLKVKLLFCFNVDPDAFDTIDTGDSRTSSDVLTIEGIAPETARTLAVCIKYDILFSETGTLSAQTRMQSKITPQEIKRRANENLGYLDAVEFVETFGKKSLPIPSSSLAFLAYRFSLFNKDFSLSWLSAFISGANFNDDADPRLWIRNRIWRETKATQKTPLVYKLGFIIRAWNIDVNGKKRITHESNLYRDPMEAFKYIAHESDKGGTSKAV